MKNFKTLLLYISFIIFMLPIAHADKNRSIEIKSAHWSLGPGTITHDNKIYTRSKQLQPNVIPISIEARKVDCKGTFKVNENGTYFCLVENPHMYAWKIAMEYEDFFDFDGFLAGALESEENVTAFNVKLSIKYTCSKEDDKGKLITKTEWKTIDYEAVRRKNTRLACC